MRSRSTREREAGGGGGRVRFFPRNCPLQYKPAPLLSSYCSSCNVRPKNVGLKFKIIWTLYPQDDTEVKVFEDENTGENEKIVEISTGPRGS